MELIYRIIKYLTFPGAILKGAFEHLTCRIYKVPVEDIKSMQANELCGHVEHEIVKRKGSFAMCFIPFLFNFLCAIIVLIPATICIVYLNIVNAFSIILMYFGISFLSNLFPLMEDAISMWEGLYSKEDSTPNITSKVLLAIPAAILYAGAWLEKYSISFLIAIGLSTALPYIVAAIIG